MIAVKTRRKTLRSNNEELNNNYTCTQHDVCLLKFMSQQAYTPCTVILATDQLNAQILVL